VDLDGNITRAQFAAPHPDLRRYISTYYLAEVNSPCGEPITDLLHPEWASVRYLCSGAVMGSIVPAPVINMEPVIVVGPSSHAALISCVSMRIVSFGLLPLGWRRFFGENASRYADRPVEASEFPAGAILAKLLPQLQATDNLNEITTIFDSALLGLLRNSKPIDLAEEAAIEKAHSALLDPEIASVAALTEYVGITTLQMERLSKRVFGFPPKLLLRRQRFLRTLAVVLAEPRSKWGEILDPQYYDQAHFNRDFRRFFGMSPRDYLAMPRPIVAAAARERMRALGHALQALQKPGGD
jgi:AraC-like DNA-binding protein